MGLCVLGGRSYALARVLSSLWVKGTLDCNGRGNGIVKCVAVGQCPPRGALDVWSSAWDLAGHRLSNRVIRGRAVPFGVVVCAAVATAACGRRACVVRGMFMLLVCRDRHASCAAWLCRGMF